ncbi:MAG: hypothetical protein ACK56F_02790 [bacterium]|jgi:hypothetical protein
MHREAEKAAFRVPLRSGDEETPVETPEEAHEETPEETIGRK